MGKEKEASYYDNIFQSDPMFNVDYKDSVYYVHWTQVIKFLGRNYDAKILEIGCGTGQLAEYIRDEGFTNYLGFDFSTLAIKKARERVNSYNFFVGNALEVGPFERNFDIVICLEVLEHVTEDLQVLRNIPIGKSIIFSIPNFNAESHVRWFVTERQIKKRYYKLLDIKQIVRIGNIFICYSIRDDYSPSIFNRITKNREYLSIDSLRLRLIHKKDQLKSYFFR